MIRKRVYCEDVSSILKSIKACKKHGKVVKINGKEYEYIGDDMLLNIQTNRIEKLVD
jgi:hypothetical protein